MKLTCTAQKLTSLAIIAIAMTCTASKAGASDGPDAPPPLTPEQHALLQKAAMQEKLLVRNITFFPPITQIYIQHMRKDPELGNVPVSDEYLLGRIDFSGTFNNDVYAQRTHQKGMFSGSKTFLGRMTSMFSLQFSENGFVDMMFTDVGGFTE